MALQRAGGSGIVALATGVGKTKIGVDYVKSLKNGGGERFLWVVPTEKLRDHSIQEEFTKWGALSTYNAYLQRSCYASLNKIKKQHFDLVVLDEGHRITENNAQFFENNTVDKILVLTATLPHEEHKQILLYNKLGLRVVYEKGVEEAVELGLIAPYQIKVIEMWLDDKEKYIEAGSKKNKFFTTEYKHYEYLSKSIRKLQFSGKEVPKFLYLNRMRFLYKLKSKIEIAKKILQNIPKDERVLIFHKSIEKAEELCYHTFHSKTDDKAYNKFIKGKINRLAVVDALNEGHNIPNLDKALIVQVNSNPRELIQRRLCALMW